MALGATFSDGSAFHLVITSFLVKEYLKAAEVQGKKKNK
jgi:hypothetical protein